MSAFQARDAGNTDADRVNGNGDGNGDGDGDSRPRLERRVTRLSCFMAPNGPAHDRGRGSGLSNDGVFANMSAKPGVGGEDEADEKPPVSAVDHRCYHHNSDFFLAPCWPCR